MSVRGRRRAARRDPLVAGVAVLVVFAVAFVLSLTHSIPFLGDDGRLVTAEFSGARQVNDKTPVRVRGIAVGEVESIAYDARRRRTEVRLRLTDDEVRLRQDASAALRWRTVLGGRMELALEPGSASAPELRGDRIALARTRVQTEFEDITQAFDGSGAEGARALLQELPQALEGPAAGRAVEALDPGLRSLRPAMRALRGERSGDLAALVGTSARTVRAMDRAQGALGDLVEGGRQTLGVTARRDAELRRTFAQAPAALRATTSVAGAIDRTLPGLDGLVADLRPGARRLGPALARTRPVVVRLDRFLRDARPLLRSLRPAVDRLATASGAGRRLLASLDPVLRRADDDLLPFLESTDDDLRLPVYQLIGPTIASLGAAGGLFHEQGHIVNFPVQPGENNVTFLPCSTFLSDPTATEKVRCDGLSKALKTLFTGPSPRRRAP